MRILHFSDVHIGVENYGRTDPEAGLSTRVLDFLATLDELVEYALAQDVDVALFCGDAYKSRDPSQTHQREFAKRIARLAAAGIPVFLVVGNHDTPHVAGRATAIDIFPTLSVRNVYVGDRLATQVVPTKSGLLQVVALPWIRRSNFLAREETRNLTLDQINAVLQERLTALLTQQVETLDPAIPAVLAAHVTLSTARASSERSMMLGQDYVLLQSAVAQPALDYVALGHIHRHQVLSYASPMVVYPGSLQRVDFGEEEETKGFCVIDLDPSKPRGQRLAGFQFQPVAARSFLTIDVNVAGTPGDPTEAVLKAVARRHVAEAVVRLRIKLDAAQEPHLREAEIRDALKDAHYVAAVSREVMDGQRTRLGPDATEGLTPVDALRLYLKNKDTPPERMQVLMKYGERLIQQEQAGDSTG